MASYIVGLVECLLNQLAVSGWSQSPHVSDDQLIFRRLGQGWANQSYYKANFYKIKIQRAKI
jgi:hypothetical protein